MHEPKKPKDGFVVLAREHPLHEWSFVARKATWEEAFDVEATIGSNETSIVSIEALTQRELERFGIVNETQIA